MMRARIKNVQSRIAQWFTSLSHRERLLVVGAGIVLTGLATYNGMETVYGAFSRQSAVQAKLEQDIRTVTNQLAQYRRLKNHKESIEQRYEKIQIKRGVREHIDSLIRNVAKATPKSITTGATDSFGSFEQTKLSVKFDSDNLENIVQLLEELTHGNQPVILSKLEITRDYRGTKLEVELDISSIRKS